MTPEPCSNTLKFPVLLALKFGTLKISQRLENFALRCIASCQEDPIASMDGNKHSYCLLGGQLTGGRKLTDRGSNVVY